MTGLFVVGCVCGGGQCERVAGAARGAAHDDGNAHRRGHFLRRMRISPGLEIRMLPR